MVFDDWKRVFNYPEADAKSQIGNNSACAIMKQSAYSLACFTSRKDGFEGGCVYRVSGKVTLTGDTRRRFLYTWLSKDGEKLFQAHVTENTEITAPEKAYTLILDYHFWSYNGGTGEFAFPSVEYVKKASHRYVTLAAVNLDYTQPRTVDDNLNESIKYIRAAAKDGADLVLLTECFYDRCVDGLDYTYRGVSEESAPISALREEARKLKIFIAFSLREIRDGLTYNAILIFDREGKTVGRYAKTHLTVGELENGIVPGNEIPVFETELGRIGCSICWDMYFPEHSRVLALKNAEIILNPSMGYDPYQHPASAYTGGAYILSAHRTHEYTRITDPLGNVIENAVGKNYIVKTIDLSDRGEAYWLSAPDTYTVPRSVFMGERRRDLYSAITDGKYEI